MSWYSQAGEHHCHAEGADSPAEAEKAYIRRVGNGGNTQREPQPVGKQTANQEEKSQQHGNHVPANSPRRSFRCRRLRQPRKNSIALTAITPPMNRGITSASNDICTSSFLYREKCVGCLVPLFPPAVELPRKVEAAGAAVLGLLHGKPGQDEAPTVGTAEMAQFNPPKAIAAATPMARNTNPSPPRIPPARHKSKTAANSVPLAAEYHFCSSFIVPSPSVNNPQIPLPQLPVQQQ